VVPGLSDPDPESGDPAGRSRGLVAVDGWVWPAGPTPNRLSTFSVILTTACFGQMAGPLGGRDADGAAGNVVDVDEEEEEVVDDVAVGDGAHSSLSLLIHQFVPEAQTPAPLGAV
jgi:hypothetical protein